MQTEKSQPEGVQTMPETRILSFFLHLTSHNKLFQTSFGVFRGDAKMTSLLKGLGSIRGYFGLSILGKLNTFVYFVSYLNNLNVIACF